MKKDSIMGKLPYESPAIASCDFRVESGIAESFMANDGKTAEDFTISGWWDEQ